MAQMKRSTLVKKMLQDPGAVAEFLDCCSPTHLAQWFPNHTVTLNTKKVKNLLTGKEIEIPANTPLCCDPSSETYHSM